MLVNYYAVLGVQKTASSDQIKRAYRQQAKSLHPDISKDRLATAKFQLLNEAYQTLINVRKRRIYDYTLRHRAEFNAKARTTKRYSGSYHSYYKFYTQQTSSESQRQNVRPDNVYKKKSIDSIMFYSLLAIGIVGIIFGIFDIFYKEWIGLSNLNGIFFSVCFTSILIYGWRLMRKTGNK